MPSAYQCYYTDTWKKHFCLYGARAYYLVILCQQHIILTECRPTAYYMTSICKQNIVVLYMPTAYCLAVCVRSLLFCQCVSTAYWYDLTVDIYINSILLCCLGWQHGSAKNYYKLGVLPTTHHIMLTVGSTAYYLDSLQLPVPVWNTYQYDLDMLKKFILKNVSWVLLNVGLYFAQTTLFWFSEITTTCTCWIPRRGSSGPIAAKKCWG
jgi:hypothetical protein